MSTNTELYRYRPTEDPHDDIIFDILFKGLVGQNRIEVEGVRIPHLETLDFPRRDPWSLLMRRAIRDRRDLGAFKGKDVTELGVGDGRNLREVGVGISGAVGIDIELWRLRIAGMNLVTGKHPLTVETELWSGDAVAFLERYREIGKQNVSGWVLACLPQSPAGLNFADRYDGSSLLDSYRSNWERSGLTLNAAVLDNLRPLADSDLRVLIILSDRVPDETKVELFARTGWEVEQKVRPKEPIQQDPDTGIAWVSKIDDGRRFYERIAQDYQPISAIEAERRRLKSMESGLGRKDLNVYHGLTVYQLQPK